MKTDGAKQYPAHHTHRVISNKPRRTFKKHFSSTSSRSVRNTRFYLCRHLHISVEYCQACHVLDLLSKQVNKQSLCLDTYTFVFVLFARYPEREGGGGGEVRQDNITQG